MYKTPPRKRSYDSITEHTDTKQWMLAFGVDPTNDAFKPAPVTRKPKTLCLGFNLENGVKCTTLVQLRRDTNGFAVCCKHMTAAHLAAIRVVASMTHTNLEAKYTDRGVGQDLNILRIAAGHIIRKATTGVRERMSAHFRSFAAHGGPVVFKFGMARMDDKDDRVDKRIEVHETGPCKAEIHHHVTSVYLDDITMFDNLVNRLLAHGQVTFTTGSWSRLKST
ncbi:hypothetical protein HDU87_002708 [Geranomyces variabilis]|uniref:Uncharacterized protein n=1 Tax=Geranomyces variabilis TaxID=109894 RepID=A0AAD5TRQ3_9FUNG|nr:hypothetical protein HDU87_002708 [Geranomyces variabilis]